MVFSEKSAEPIISEPGAPPAAAELPAAALELPAGAEDVVALDDELPLLPQAAVSRAIPAIAEPSRTLLFMCLPLVVPHSGAEMRLERRRGGDSPAGYSGFGDRHGGTSPRCASAITTG